MADVDPLSEYADADDDMRDLIRTLLKRQERHRWFQNFMQVAGTCVGLFVVIYVLDVSADLIRLGETGPVTGGVLIGSADLVALATAFIYGYRHRGEIGP